MASEIAAESLRHKKERIGDTFVHVMAPPQRVASLHTHTFSYEEEAPLFPQEYEGTPVLQLPEETSPPWVVTKLVVETVIECCSLAWMATKLAVEAANRSLYCLKTEMETLNSDISKAQSGRMQTLSKDATLRKATRPWSIMTKIMSWIGSCMTFIAGVVLIATGSGVAAGTLLVASGVLSLTNHLLEATGGWNKIAEKFGGGNPTKTKAIIMWMQIAIAIISLILAGAAVVFGGFSTVKEVLGHAGMLSGAVISAGIGIMLIGKSTLDKKTHDNQAKMKYFDTQLMQFGHERDNNLETTEELSEAVNSFWEQFFAILRLQRTDTKRIITMR